MKRIKLFSICLCGLILSSCGNKDVVEDKGTVEFATMTLFKESPYNTLMPRPIFSNPKMLNNVEFEYVIEDDNIVSFENNYFTYKNKGNTKVTAKSEDFTYTFDVICLENYDFDSAYKNIKTTYIAKDSPTEQTLFIGDSFFQFWRDNTIPGRSFAKDFKGRNCYNIGMNGSQTKHWRVLVKEFVKEMKPKNIILNLGTNNINVNSDTGLIVSKKIMSLIEDFHYYLEDTNIYYVSITRCTGTFSKNWNDAKMSNEIVKEYIDNRDYVNYLDLNEIFGDDYADYLYDGLHLNNKGYGVLKDLILENVTM